MGSKIKKDLVIGATSQIGRYTSSNNIKIDSSKIDNNIFFEEWNRVYICFAEQRTSLSKDKNFKDTFYDVNVIKTLKIVDNIKAKKIVFLSTTELWNLCEGPISLDTKFNFEQNYYTDSKYKITKKMIERDNVVIAYPYNFNSKFRSKYFLFGKIFHSVNHKQKIEIGNTDFKRELLHAKFVSDKIEKMENDSVIGAGRLVHVGNFIKDIYKSKKLEYNELVKHTAPITSYTKRKENWYSVLDEEYDYSCLLSQTLAEMK